MKVIRKVINGCFIFVILFYSLAALSANYLPSNNFLIDHATVHLEKEEFAKIATSTVKVFIATPKTQFSKDWLQRFKKETSRNYRRKILTKYNRVLKNELNDVLASSNNFELVNSKNAADIIFNPSLQDIYIYAPDHEIQKKYVLQSGKANFKVTITTPNGEVLAKYADKEKTAISGKISTLESNLNDFKHLMKNWSNQTVAHLSYSIKSQTFLASQPN